MQKLISVLATLIIATGAAVPVVTNVTNQHQNNIINRNTLAPDETINMSTWKQSSDANSIQVLAANIKDWDSIAQLANQIFFNGSIVDKDGKKITDLDKYVSSEQFGFKIIDDEGNIYTDRQLYDFQNGMIPHFHIKYYAYDNVVPTDKYHKITGETDAKHHNATVRVDGLVDLSAIQLKTTAENFEPLNPSDAKITSLATAQRAIFNFIMQWGTYNNAAFSDDLKAEINYYYTDLNVKLLDAHNNEITTMSKSADLLLVKSVQLVSVAKPQVAIFNQTCTLNEFPIAITSLDKIKDIGLSLNLTAVNWDGDWKANIISSIKTAVINTQWIDETHVNKLIITTPNITDNQWDLVNGGTLAVHIVNQNTDIYGHATDLDLPIISQITHHNDSSHYAIHNNVLSIDTEAYTKHFWDINPKDVPFNDVFNHMVDLLWENTNAFVGYSNVNRAKIHVSYLYYGARGLIQELSDSMKYDSWDPQEAFGPTIQDNDLVVYITGIKDGASLTVDAQHHIKIPWEFAIAQYNNYGFPVQNDLKWNHKFYTMNVSDTNPDDQITEVFQ